MNRFGRSRLIGTAVLVVSLIALLLSAVTGYRSREQAQCQARVNQQLVVALRARAEAVDARDAEFDRMLNTILTASTAEQRRRALEDYRAAQAKVTGDRAEHPLPPPPMDTCG